MYIGLLHTHRLVVILFLLLYLVKTVLLLSGKYETLKKVTAKTKVPEMVISTLFLVTGIWMMFLIPQISTLLIVKIVVVFAAIPIAVIGFRRYNKALGTLALLLIIGSYGLAEMSRRNVQRQELASEVVTDPQAAAYDLALHGQAVYQTYCVQCHGEEGDLQMAGAKNLKISKVTMPEIKAIVKNGKGAMMGYSDVLTEQEIEAVSTYTNTLKGE